MNTENISILDSFGVDNIPNLDIVVLGALELFQQAPLPKIDLSAYKHPLVVGSGNAEATGRIIFSKSDAIFASESNFESKLLNISSIDGVVLISASGEKHAPIIARKAREMGKRVMLITNSPNSSASKVFEDDKSEFDEFISPKNREPYTYNTSNYLSMILGWTGENPAEIAKFIHETVDSLELPDFSKYDKYFVILPPEYSEVVRMISVKFMELFGRNIARDVETTECMKHATTVAPSNELFISFGQQNNDWGQPENRFFVPLPENANYGAMIAIGYYMVGKIQAAYPNYFKDNIVSYAEDCSRIFGQTIRPIVEK